MGTNANLGEGEGCIPTLFWISFDRGQVGEGGTGNLVEVGEGGPGMDENYMVDNSLAYV